MANSKENVTPMTLINESLKRMDWAGFNPQKRMNFKIIVASILIFVVSVLFLLQIIYLFSRNYRESGYSGIDMVTMTGCSQIMMKHYTILLKQRLLMKLINIIKTKFWSVNDLEESKHEVQPVYNMAKLSMNYYSICITLTLLGHCTSAYFRGNENLLLNIWMPESLIRWNKTFTGHLIIYLVQVIITTYAVMVPLIKTDHIYITLIAVVLGQFKILKFKLLSICDRFTIKENIDCLVTCIKHHNLLLEYLNDIEVIFSKGLFHIAGSNIIVSVLAMYSALLEENTSQIMTYVFTFTAVNSQLFIYCFLGQLIQDETESVVEAAYLCKWEDIPDKHLQDSLILIILRSQQKVSITMGGLFTLNLETFTKVARTMLSLLTFLTTLSRKEG